MVASTRTIRVQVTKLRMPLLKSRHDSMYVCTVCLYIHVSNSNKDTKHDKTNKIKKPSLIAVASNTTNSINEIRVRTPYLHYI